MPKNEWEGHWFDPVAFTERWLEEEWPKKDPREFACYLSAYERWGDKNEP